MKEKSIAKESTVCLLCRIINIILATAISIYVARTITPSVLGNVKAAQNLAAYFIIFAHLGIPAYGMREVARNKDDKEKLNKIYSELMVINAIFTSVSLLCYIGLVFSVPNYRDNYQIYLIIGLLIFLNYFDNNWLFQGLEEISRMSLRTVFSRVFYLVFLILFVKKDNPSSHLIYGSLIVASTGLNFLLNMIWTHKHVQFGVKNLNFRQHIKAITILVCISIANLIHALTDVTMINLMCSDSDLVAYYTTANQTKTIIIDMIGAVSFSAIPRLNSYYKNKEYDKINNLISKSLIIILMFSIPAIIGIWFTVDNLFMFIYTPDYLEAAKILKILSFLILISSVCELIGFPILLATGNEKKILVPVITGATLNIALNSFMIMFWQAKGAAIASIISRTVVLIIYIVINRDKFKIVNFKSSLLKIVFSATAMTGFLLGASFIPLKPIYVSIIQVCGAIIIYISLLFILKEDVLIQITGKVKTKIKEITGKGKNNIKKKTS